MLLHCLGTIWPVKNTNNFTYNLKEWQWDGIFLAIESATEDLVGAHAIPWIEAKVVGNEWLEKFTKFAAPPALVGVQHVAIKRFLTDSEQSVGSEVMLSLGSKATADWIINSLM